MLKIKKLLLESHNKFYDKVRNSDVYNLILKAGCKDVTSPKQILNGTAMFSNEAKGVAYSIHSNGYIRRYTPTDPMNGEKLTGSQIAIPSKTINMSVDEMLKLLLKKITSYKGHWTAGSNSPRIKNIFKNL